MELLATRTSGSRRTSDSYSVGHSRRWLPHTCPSPAVHGLQAERVLDVLLVVDDVQGLDVYQLPAVRTTTWLPTVTSGSVGGSEASGYRVYRMQ